MDMQTAAVAKNLLHIVDLMGACQSLSAQTTDRCTLNSVPIIASSLAKFPLFEVSWCLLLNCDF